MCTQFTRYHKNLKFVFHQQMQNVIANPFLLPFFCQFLKCADVIVLSNSSTRIRERVHSRVWRTFLAKVDPCECSVLWLTERALEFDQKELLQKCIELLY